MKVIRAVMKSTVKYAAMFRKVSGLTFGEYWHIRHLQPFEQYKSYTEDLTALRKFLVSQGYEPEVEKTDALFIERHHGFPTEEAWQKFWQEMHSKYGDEQYPESAL